MDVKVDFVPPSLINFISRQLIGNGFRLYQKVAVPFRLYLDIQLLLRLNYYLVLFSIIF